MSYALDHHYVSVGLTNPIRLHVVQAGPTNGPLIILLHGFPEFWFSWRHQISPLVEAGYRVWVPDQRGYNLSDKPTGTASYTIDALAADVIGLIDAAGRQTATVVGHDWGAAVGWWVAATYPSRIERLVTINVPHPAVMKRFVSRDPEQLMRSWYIGFFQLPGLPEATLRLGNWGPLTRMMQSSSRPGTFSVEDLAQYRAAWSQPGPDGTTAMTTMIHWYRAALRYPPTRDVTVRITVPTTLLWGVHDRFLNRAMARPSIDLCDKGNLVFFEQATHWVQHEEPEEVVKHIITSSQPG